ncbi:hypothetical protein GCM10018952_40750 [Streptosporangium vulgare]
MSAYGQEAWAQQELSSLRSEWRDWAFLVVRYRWIALRGRESFITASGPSEMRAALALAFDSAIPAADEAKADLGGGTASSPVAEQSNAAEDLEVSRDPGPDDRDMQGSPSAHGPEPDSRVVEEDRIEEARWWALPWWRSHRHSHRSRSNAHAELPEHLAQVRVA